MSSSGYWVVSPETQRDSRPTDCYDVEDASTGETVISSIMFAEAEKIAVAHNAVIDELMEEQNG